MQAYDNLPASPARSRCGVLFMWGSISEDEITQDVSDRVSCP